MQILVCVVPDPILSFEPETRILSEQAATQFCSEVAIVATLTGGTSSFGEDGEFLVTLPGATVCARPLVPLEYELLRNLINVPTSKNITVH